MDAKLGWLSPDGTLIEADWGSHTTVAETIISLRGWDHEFASLLYANQRDFLCDKGYCLLHDPGRNDIQATHIRPLTKFQRNFLFDYFEELGDKRKAKHYLLEEF